MPSRQHLEDRVLGEQRVHHRREEVDAGDDHVGVGVGDLVGARLGLVLVDEVTAVGQLDRAPSDAGLDVGADPAQPLVDQLHGRLGALAHVGERARRVALEVGHADDERLEAVVGRQRRRLGGGERRLPRRGARAVDGLVDAPPPPASVPGGSVVAMPAPAVVAINAAQQAPPNIQIRPLRLIDIPPRSFPPVAVTRLPPRKRSEVECSARQRARSKFVRGRVQESTRQPARFDHGKNSPDRSGAPAYNLVSARLANRQPSAPCR